ncbi:CHASE3 domain-containing protein [Acidicapsa acidisoli]|uniref:CHASE3 domain-containing protein n=1 Tax=Acidicapsa acidisoli TaxID=1615681 RepID=UPI0021E020EA|nr:CHASE3 domain-containing protein [Acidicapsa acidisoli]
MQTIYRRFSVVSGFSFLLILLVANALIVRRQLAAQISDQEWMAHTRQVLFELSETESLLNDAESGQRGYLYTGDTKYLVPYNQAISQVMPHIDEIARMTMDNPRQQEHIPVLRNLTRDKLSELARTIDLYRSGKTEDAKALVVADSGLFLMNAIREQAEAMEQEERSLEAIREPAYQRSLQITIASIYLASLLAAIGLILLAYFVLREMDLRERHAAQIREREEWFRVTLTSLGDAVIAADKDGKVTFLNPVAERLTGSFLEQARGKDIDEIFPIFNELTFEPAENPVRKVMEEGNVIGLANHTVLRHVNGSLTPIEDSAAPIFDDRNNLVGVVLVFRDATHERESQEILRKTEKLAAAARLAATFAHEINNPLEAVINLVYIAKETDGLPNAALQPLELAEHELDRISHIARQTLGFYRESKVPGSVYLPTLIENVLKLYSNKLKAKNIRVEREFSQCPPIQGLAGELTQAVSNLISNAADAVAFDGTIRIEVSAVQESNREWIRLVIEDDGPGISAHLKERIFEPFFTTKIDVGTGLGLWVTKEIVHRHGGTISVERLADAELPGAVFSILLPGTPGS